MRVSRSGFGLGVSVDMKRKKKKFRARLFHRGRIELGRYCTPLEARLAYDQAVRLVSGGAPLQTNHELGEHAFWDPRVAEKVENHLQHLAELDAAGGEGEGQQDAGDDQDEGEDPAIEHHALHDGSDGTDDAAFFDSVQAAADALAAAHALWPADDSKVGLPQPGLPISAAGAVQAAAADSAAAAAAQGAPAAGLQPGQLLLQPQAGFAGLAGGSNLHMPHQQPAAPMNSTAPGAGAWGPGAAAGSAAGPAGLVDMLVDLRDEVQQLGPQAAPAAAQQQQRQPGSFPRAPLQQQHPEDSSNHSSAGSDPCHSSSPSAAAAAAAAGYSPPAYAAQQAAHMGDIPYRSPTSSFRPLAPMGPPQALQQLLPTPLAAGDLLRCVDLSVSHLMHLYARLTSQPLQHSGQVAVSWLAGVRAQNTSLLGNHGGVPPSVYCTTIHVCAALVSVAAAPPGGAVFGPFNCSFLLVVLELLSQNLLSLRELCDGVHPAHHLSGGAMQAWREGLRAQTYSKAGQAVAAVLSFL